jgi:mono/diheme cytochrome c family protein
MTEFKHIEAARSGPDGIDTAKTRVSRLRAAAISVAAFVALLAASAVKAQDAPAGDAEKGLQIYLKVACFTCHGRVGQGGAYNQPTPSLAKTALPFEGFKFQLRNPVRDMPAYADTLMSDQDIADVYAFVRSLPGKRDPKDIPLLQD